MQGLTESPLFSATEPSLRVPCGSLIPVHQRVTGRRRDGDSQKDFRNVDAHPSTGPANSSRLVNTCTMADCAVANRAYPIRLHLQLPPRRQKLRYNERQHRNDAKETPIICDACAMYSYRLEINAFQFKYSLRQSSALTNFFQTRRPRNPYSLFGSTLLITY